jgi:hypothetical protein
MRSPGPNDGQRGPQQQGAMMYNGEKSKKLYKKLTLAYHRQYLHFAQSLTHLTDPQYYAQALGPPQDYGQHANSQYYQQQTQVHGSQYYDPQLMLTQASQGQHPGYGPVPPSHYYPGPQPQTYDYDQRRKHGFEALDQFLGEVKRQQIATNDYQSITNRLFALQGLQLPLIAQQPVTSIPAYQPVSALGGGYHDADPIQAYSLPPMGNAKTREDLTSIDQILEQMQATIYENETGAVNQQGSAYAGYHPVNSPNATLPSTHAQTAALARSHQNSLSGTEHASTPGLTPPSSAQSYTSGHSPMTGHAAPSSGAMYPNLPAGDMGYQTGNGATLGSHYDNEDPRRRFSGGMLQRAQPARDRRSEGSATPPAAEMNKKSATKGKKKGSPAQSAIDPALSGEGTPGSKGEMSKEEPEHNRNHDNMRLIEWMREFIHKQVQKLDTDGVDITTDGGDVEMGGTEENLKQDAAALYPLMNDLKGA